jgi:hypothetical protein
MLKSKSLLHGIRTPYFVFNVVECWLVSIDRLPVQRSLMPHGTESLYREGPFPFSGK